MPRAAVIVGLGGIGKVVLMKIRRLIVEEYGSLFAFPRIRFIHVDTCATKGVEIGQDVNEIVLGQNIIFDDVERVELSKNLGGDPVSHDNVKLWYPENLPLKCNFTEGAGGVRPFGKLAFHYNVHEFRQTFNRAVVEATSAGNTDGFDVYIVCSLFGGTGSGTFLDVCYNARDELDNMQRNYKSLGFFIIGSENPDQTMQSNCYAALKELEYYTTKGILTTLKTNNTETSHALFDHFGEKAGEYRPFEARYPVSGASEIVSDLSPVDNCYLFGAVNSEEKSLNRASLEKQVARRIFFELMPGIGETMRAKRIDIEGKDAYYSPDRLLNRAKSFFATGVSTIEFPAPQIMNALAFGFTAYCCQYALFIKARGFSDLKNDVEKFIRELGLTEKILRKDLEKQDTGTVTDSINNDTNEWKRAIFNRIAAKDFDEDGLLQEIRKVKDEALDRIKEGEDTKKSGVYVQTIRNNGANLWGKTEEKIESLIGSYVGDKEKGPKHTEGLVSLLLDRLHNEGTGFSEGKQSSERRVIDSKKKVDWRIERFRDDLYPKYRWELKKHANWLCEQELSLFMNMGKQRIFFGVAYDLITRAEDKLRALQSRLNRYKENLTNWQNMYLDNMFEVLDNLKNQMGDDQVNQGLMGIIRKMTKKDELSDSFKGFFKSLFEAYNIPIPVTDLDEEAEKILKSVCKGGLENALFRKVLTDPETFKSSVFTACRETFRAIESVNICDLLVQTDEAARRDIFSKKKKEAGWFLKVHTHDKTIDHVPGLFEMKWAGVSNTNDIRTHPVWNDLTEYNADRARFNSLQEPYRMVFTSEMGVFCMRNIDLVKNYKETYDGYSSPCHVNKQINFPDIMPPDPRLIDIHLRAENAALMGRILGFLKEEEDPEDNYSKIYLHYSDQATSTMRNENLCREWKEVERTLRDVQAEKEIDKKTGDATCLEKLESEINKKAKSAKTRDDKEALWLVTDKYLKERLSELKDEKHSFYQKDLGIIENFRKKFNLHAPGHERS
ncbi:MAG: tubulin-like doman-containing protein [Pirellulales bacterium]|nr:tubulin-like doman-containing protein [Pirellulales bacterium]